MKCGLAHGIVQFDSIIDRCIVRVGFHSAPLPRGTLVSTSYDFMVFASRFSGRGQGEGELRSSPAPSP